MTTIVAVHSFRGGTGKSNLTANLAGQLAQAGFQVGVVDTDIQSPGIHVLFGFGGERRPDHTLNEFLAGTCGIAEVATDVTAGLPRVVDGRVLLVASSVESRDITAILQHGYDAEQLNDALLELGTTFALDFLLVDTHPGLNEETLLTAAICDVLVVILRPDSQDYQGTAVTLDVAQRLGVPERILVVNKIFSGIAPEVVIDRVQAAYGLPVVAALPLTEDLARNASDGLFSLSSPEHPWSRGVAQLASRLAGSG